MQPSMPFSRLAASAALGLLAACSSSGSSHGHGIFAPTVQEQEPNDAAFAAQGIGALDANDCLLIEGHASAFDTDGFAFVAAQDIEVRVELNCYDPFADLDLCVWDPFLGEYVLCLLTPGDEYGSFTVAAGFEFHLVVDGFFGGSSYDLYVETSPALFGFAGAATGDSAASAQGLSPLSEGVELDAQPADRRAGFEQYLQPAKTSDAVQPPRVVLIPGPPMLPMAPMALVLPSA
ncbi:MAG: hypothetical protein AAFZ65_01240 [Planctomycetota bacterium]